MPCLRPVAALAACLVSASIGAAAVASDEQKCKRSPGISSTARLFPARPSPDFDNYP
jgi:hypothetical protein